MNIHEPTEEQIAQWKEWVASRPEKVRATIEAHGLTPWKLYRMKSTGHRVTLYAVDEPYDGSPCTVKVNVTGEFNVVAFERRVFGVAPEDLEECDLPSATEPVGSFDLDPQEAARLAREIKARKPS